MLHIWACKTIAIFQNNLHFGRFSICQQYIYPSQATCLCNSDNDDYQCSSRTIKHVHHFCDTFLCSLYGKSTISVLLLLIGFGYVVWITILPQTYDVTAIL